MAIGFIGLGIMGSRMAANLQRAGYELVIHNRTRAKGATLLANGAKWADTPSAVGERAEVLFTMLANPEAVSEMAMGQDGFLNSLPSGALWVDCSTVNPSFSRRMAGEASVRGIRCLDAPVTGSKAAAEAGELQFLIGGDQADLEACQPYLNAMGRRVVYAGGHGMGTSLKMVFNLLLGEAMLAFSEAMALGQSLGISRDALFAFLIGGPVVAPMVAMKKAKFEADQYDPEFPLRWMRKDLQLAAVTAYEQGVVLQGGNAAKEIYTLAARSGLAEQDYSAIYRFLNGPPSPEGSASTG